MGCNDAGTRSETSPSMNQRPLRPPPRFSDGCAALGVAFTSSGVTLQSPFLSYRANNGFGLLTNSSRLTRPVMVLVKVGQVSLLEHWGCLLDRLKFCGTDIAIVIAIGQVAESARVLLPLVTRIGAVVVCVPKRR